MKIKTKITALLASLTFLASCKESEEYGYHHTVGEENNAITLMAGISEGGAKLQTRAVDGNHDADVTYGGGHTLITTGAKMLLDVRGKWKKTESGEATSVTQTTTITIGGEGNGTEHNSISNYNPVLYWDDYGTADPNNATAGRAEGLTIYGVGVNKSGADVPTINGTDNGKKWTELYWSVGNPSGTPSTIDQSSDWTQYDLITSNNIRAGADGTLKFQEWKDKTNPSDILEFTHAMSKVTVRLIAGEGFPTTGVGGTTQKFASAPEVILTSNVGTATTNQEWPLTSGNVNVETKVVSSQTAPAKITMHQGTVPSTDVSNYTVIYDALVMPGSMFEDKGTGASDPYPVIARIKADDNIYYVTSEMIRAKMKDLNSSTDYKTESGKNYIITVTVNKTKIEVTATITDWIDVKAETVTPTINITADWGTTTGASTVDGFSFYRSLSLNNGYSNGLSTNANDYFAAEAIAKKPSTDGAQWVFNDGTKDIKLFWPTHDTHYQFRGVWPMTGTETSNTATVPHVKALSESDDTQIINISNVAYSANSYPSDLMIARPEFGLQSDGTEIDPECTNSDHTHKKLYSEGICATEGKIIMNFQYVMSQVEVELQTVSGDAAVNIGANTKVEIVNVANDGYVKLGDRIVVPNTQDQTYVLNPANTESLTGDALTKAQRTRHSAIVPQTLTYTDPGASTNVRFKVTIYKGDSTTDVDDIYYADIKKIMVKEPGDTDPKEISKWESGKHYIYTLTLSKTAINVTATITDWKEVKASQNIWF